LAAKKLVSFQAVCFSFWVRVSEMCSPEGWQNNSPWQCLDIIDWFYPFPDTDTMQKTLQMHLNTSPTSFDPLRGRKTQQSFRNHKK